VGSAFDDGAAIGKKSELVRITPELEDEVVVLHRAVRLEA
jgi:hypothetical protein